MAVSKNYILVVLVLAIASVNWQHGLALRIDISPNQVSEIITERVNVTCTADGSSKSIVVLEINKDGGKSLAILKINSNAELSLQAKGNFEVDGRLTSSTGVNSFLTLTLRDPSKEDAGTYTCLMYYLDGGGVLAAGRVSSNLTIDDDANTVLIYLVDKLKNQQTEIEDEKSKVKLLEQQIKQQLGNGSVTSGQRIKEEVVTLEETVRKLQNVIKEQNNSMVNQKDRMEMLEHQLMDQESRLLDQAMCYESYNKTLAGIENKLDFQQRQLKDQQSLLTNFSSNTPVTSRPSPIAFHVGYDSYTNSLHLGDVAVFSYSVLNEGGAYNTTTGLFHAPTSGLYVFQLVGTTLNPGNDLYIDILANHVTMSRSYIIDGKFADQSGASCVVKLHPGDVVKPVVTTMQDSSGMESYPYSWFSGYLITSP